MADRFSSKQYSDSVENYGTIIESSFQPAWWLNNKHLQTIVPRFYSVPCDFRVWHNEFSLSDGDFLDISWTQDPSTISEQQPLVLILHGLEGNIDSFYAKRMMNAMYQNGWTGVLMHFRGCGKKTNRKAQTYHSGQTADVHEFLIDIKKRFPNNPLYAIGFSLGGNVLAKYVGELGETLVDGAIVISAPLDLEICANALSEGFAKVYQKYLVDKLKRSTSAKIEALGDEFPLPLTIENIYNIETLVEFDEMVTAPLNGFDSGIDYYHKSSANNFLGGCDVPTLVIHAKDDPFMTPEVVPAANKLSRFVQLEVSESGGHVGFLSGNNPLKPEFWAESRSVEFIKEQLGKLS